MILSPRAKTVPPFKVGNGRNSHPEIQPPSEPFLLDNIHSKACCGVVSGRIMRPVPAIPAVIRQNRFKVVWVALDATVRVELAEFKCGAMRNVSFEYLHKPEGDRGCTDKTKECHIGWATGELLDITTQGAVIPLDIACHMKSLLFDNATGRFFDKDNMTAKFTRADLVIFCPDGGARCYNGR